MDEPTTKIAIAIGIGIGALVLAAAGVATAAAVAGDDDAVTGSGARLGRPRPSDRPKDREGTVAAAVAEFDGAVVQGQLDEDDQLLGTQAPRHDAGRGG